MKEAIAIGVLLAGLLTGLFLTQKAEASYVPGQCVWTPFGIMC